MDGGPSKRIPKGSWCTLRSILPVLHDLHCNRICPRHYNREVFICMQGERLAAVVPGTVLTTLIHNGIYPDPDMGLNHFKIPDIFHAGRDFYTYYFCNSFMVPSSWSSSHGARARLILRGVNYSARYPLSCILYISSPEEHFFLVSGLLYGVMFMVLSPMSRRKAVLFTI